MTLKTHDEKMKAIALAKASLDKRFGKGSLQFGDADIVPTEAISTGCMILDTAIGVGGIPRGWITEIYGDEATGKTTLALCVAAVIQSLGGVVAYVDAENALDPVYTGALGVKWHEMLLSQPQSAEEALETTRALIQSAAVDLVVVDSVSALTPNVELEGAIGDYHVGNQARLMGQAMRILPSVIKSTNTAVIFINQMRATIASYGPTKTTSGGRALRYAAGVRIELSRIEKLAIKATNEQYGNKIKANILKNKVAPPYKTVEYHLVNGVGIDDWATTLDYAKKFNLVKSQGAGYHYLIDPITGVIDEKAFAQGGDTAIEYLKTTDVGQTLKQNVKEAWISRQRENKVTGEVE